MKTPKNKGSYDGPTWVLPFLNRKLYHPNNAQLGLALMRAGVTHWHAGQVEVGHKMICNAYRIMMVTHGPNHSITKDLEVWTENMDLICEESMIFNDNLVVVLPGHPVTDWGGAEGAEGERFRHEEPVDDQQQQLCPWKNEGLSPETVKDPQRTCSQLQVTKVWIFTGTTAVSKRWIIFAIKLELFMISSQIVLLLAFRGWSFTDGQPEELLIQSILIQSDQNQQLSNLSEGHPEFQLEEPLGYAVSVVVGLTGGNWQNIVADLPKKPSWKPNIQRGKGSS